MKEAQELWDKIFPLKKGIKVRLKVDTDFVWEDRLGHTHKQTEKAGKIGRVYFYLESSPLIYVSFGGKRVSTLEVKRVEKVLE